MEKNNSKCICENLPQMPENTVVTMAYVPMQTDLSTYPCNEALNNGTLFPELNKRFFGGKCNG